MLGLAMLCDFETCTVLESDLFSLKSSEDNALLTYRFGQNMKYSVFPFLQLIKNDFTFSC